MKGRRIHTDEQGHVIFRSGDYGKTHDGVWHCMPPGEDSMLGSLANHEVTEHEDGTITVKPSILIQGEDGDRKLKWHGYLERGEWRTC